MSLMELLERLKRYNACDVSDALLKLGHRTGGRLPDIDLLSGRHGQSAPPPLGQPLLLGLAQTVEMGYADECERLPGDHFLDQVCDALEPSQQAAAAMAAAPPPPPPPPTVLVVAAPETAQNAVWGGLMTARAQTAGLAGVVLVGRARDMAEHDATGFIVFARGTSTLGQGPYLQPRTLGGPLTVRPRGSGGLTVSHDAHSTDMAPPPGRHVFQDEPTVVRPGDVIVGDVNGVVCVPRAMLSDVVARCATACEADERCMQALKAGARLTETFKRYR